MNHLTQAYLKDLAKQYTEGLICDVELLYQMQLGSPVAEQVQQLMQMPQDVRLRVQIEHLTKHHRPNPDFDQLMSNAFGTPESRATAKKVSKTELSAKREAKFWTKMSEVLGAEEPSKLADLILITCGEDDSDEDTFVFRFLSLLQAQAMAEHVYDKKAAKSKHLRPKANGRFHEVLIDSEWLRACGFDVPSSLLNQRRKYLKKLCTFVYGDFRELDTFGQVTLSRHQDGDLRFTFPNYLDSEAMFLALEHVIPVGTVCHLQRWEQEPKVHVLSVAQELMERLNLTPSPLFFE